MSRQLVCKHQLAIIIIRLDFSREFFEYDHIREIDDKAFSF